VPSGFPEYNSGWPQDNRIEPQLFGTFFHLGPFTTHQFESFSRVVAVEDKTGSFEQCISARG
jgi:hypothetical protein